MAGKKAGRNTRLVHTGCDIDPHTGALSVPLIHASTFRQKSVTEFGEYDYSRSGNPTRETLEKIIADLEGGSHGYAFASGMAAISAALMIFSPGDHLVVCEDVYGGTWRMLTGLLSRFGIEATFADATDVNAFEKAVIPGRTKALYLETPSNPLMKITDLKAMSALAKKYDLITLVDNTFMSPYLQRPLELGCDIVLHSGTKFINGHSDVLCGFAVTADKALGKRIKYIQNSVGAVLPPNDCWLVIRGLKTLGVRMEAGQKSAQIIAEALEKHPNVKQVFYPGLKSHKGYEINKAQSDGAGAVLSFELKTPELTHKLLKEMEYAVFAVSLGGVESIISYPPMMSHAAMPPAERAARGISDSLVRLSLGVEDAEDVLEDILRIID
ncbi:MAG: PLP-dependent aspartate aminotransferase family protein [Deferribacterales bacterium]